MERERPYTCISILCYNLVRRRYNSFAFVNTYSNFTKPFFLSQVCLENLLFESGLGQRCVRCPECRGVCVWRGLHELPKNYILLRVMSSSSSSSSPQKPPLNPPTRPHNVSLIQWPNLPLFLQISHFTSFATESIPRLIEQKLWDIGKLLWALGVMLLFVPLSFAHMILAWSTAILGSFVFIWFSLGSMGIAVFMFFTWCSYNLAQFLVEFSWIQFNRMCLQPTPYDLLHRWG